MRFYFFAKIEMKVAELRAIRDMNISRIDTEILTVNSCRLYRGKSRCFVISNMGMSDKANFLIPFKMTVGEVLLKIYAIDAL